MGWIRIADAVSSFPWSGLPPDVHFSLSYNPKSDLMNLHLTRNVGGVPKENKPQIRIAQFPKAQAEEIVKIFFYRSWQEMFSPFDMARYQYRRSAKGQGARYCSISRLLKTGKEHFLHRELKAQLIQHMRRKRNGKELVFQQELIPEMERWARSPDVFWSWIDELKRVPRYFPAGNEIGFLHARDFTGMVIHVQGQWFRFNEQADLTSIFRAVFEADAYDALQARVKEAIAFISTATTYTDTCNFGAPIDLAIVDHEKNTAP